MSEWWNKDGKIPLSDKNFQNIIEFYLFNCPCETEKGTLSKGTKVYTKVSKRACSLRQQGWSGGHLNTLLAAMKKTTSGHLEYHLLASDADILKETCVIQECSSLNDEHFEMILIHKRNDMSKASAIFYYIRNSLAHGSFSVVTYDDKRVYYLESAKGNVVKARLRLREETLLEWIKVFLLSPKVLREALERERYMRGRKNKRKNVA